MLGAHFFAIKIIKKLIEDWRMEKGCLLRAPFSLDNL